eukprot:GHVH01003637.1.p1 GENE.GHVH01003637.1~~GHVH01003637.1.p1  ORF type:complete len:571 (+),score=88.18 GHVH01003637.1:84-1796(+)
MPSPTGSPVSWAGDYARLEHKDTCPVREIKREMMRMAEHSKPGEDIPSALLTELLNQKAPGASLPTHTQRLMCECMNPFDFDRHICLELMSRDLCMEAYSHLMLMSDVYPLSMLMKDKYLRLIAMNYMTIKQLYVLLAQDAPLTPKAIKLGVKPQPTRLELPVIAADNLSDAIYCTDQMGLFGTLFDDIIEGKPLQTRNPRKPLADLYVVPWKPAVSEEEIKVWYRVYDGGVDFRVEGIVPTSIHDIISITSEVEMAKLWMPSIKVPKMGLGEAKCIKRTGRFTKVSLYQVDLPYPLSNVEVVVQGSLSDDLERNNILTVVMSSFDENASPAEKETWPIKVPPVAKGHQRVQFGGGCVFEPMGKERVSMKTVWTVKMEDRPNERLLEFVSSKFLKMAFGKFIGTVQKNSDKFAIAQKDDPWLYGHLEKRMLELADVGLDPLGERDRKEAKSGVGFTNGRQGSVFISYPPPSDDYVNGTPRITESQYGMAFGSNTRMDAILEKDEDITKEHLTQKSKKSKKADKRPSCDLTLNPAVSEKIKVQGSTVSDIDGKRRDRFKSKGKRVLRSKAA